MTRLPEEDWLGVPVPVIVDQDTFGAVQRQLKSNTVRCKRNTGEIHCGICGRRMAIQPARPGRSPAYYICPSERPGDRRYYADQSRQPERRCAARSVSAQTLDAQVWLYAEQLMSSEKEVVRAEMESHYKAQVPERLDARAVLEDLLQQEEKALKQRDRIAKWYREDLLSGSEADRQLREIRQELLDIQARKNSLEGRLRSSGDDSASLALIVDRLAAVVDPQAMSFEERRQLLLDVFEKIMVQRIDDAAGRGAMKKARLELQFELPLSPYTGASHISSTSDQPGVPPANARFTRKICIYLILRSGNRHRPEQT